MKRIMSIIAITLFLGIGVLFIFFQKSEDTMQNPESSSIIEYTLRSIASDIEQLKNGYPQLQEYSAEKNIDLERLVIEYSYKTHDSELRGGWTSGVPNPDPDGIWLYIDMHEPNSAAQIHIQPEMPNLCYGDKRVAFLILEGAKTKTVKAEISRILSKTVLPCPEGTPDGLGSL